MSDDRADQINTFFRDRVPGLLGVEFVSLQPNLIVGTMEVTEALIAGTGYLFAPAIIALADTLCAGGVGENRREGAVSFTTIELKANFLGSARAGETVEGRATPAHLGRTTQVWDTVVRNTTTDKTIALYRCTQMILYPQGT